MSLLGLSLKLVLCADGADTLLAENSFQRSLWCDLLLGANLRKTLFWFRQILKASRLQSEKLRVSVSTIWHRAIFFVLNILLNEHDRLNNFFYQLCTQSNFLLAHLHVWLVILS